MNRKEIKELAKKKIKGNLWNLLWPTLLIGFVEGFLSGIIAPNYSNSSPASVNQISPTQAFLLLIVGIIGGIFLIAYKKYVLNFVRTGKMEFKDIIDCVKVKWQNILLSEILVGILVFLASLLFVIPGIILGFAYSMVTYLVVDTELNAADSLKKSREIMKGYKLDYFIFTLSFIGWILLTPFTLGLLLIWLAPYMEVSEAIYYEKLKEKNNIK